MVPILKIMWEDPIFQRPPEGEVRLIWRSLVDDKWDRGPCRKTQAGGSRPGRARASFSPIRLAERAAAVLDRTAFRVQPGRSITAIGIMRAMRRQPRQRWKLARLSAPMIQTK